VYQVARTNNIFNSFLGDPHLKKEFTVGMDSFDAYKDRAYAVDRDRWREIAQKIGPHAATDMILESILRRGGNPAEDRFFLFSQIRARGGEARYEAKLRSEYSALRRGRGAKSLLKKAMRSWKSKRSSKPITTRLTTISGLTVGHTRRRPRSIEKGPKKGDSIMISRSGRDVIHSPVVVWGRGQEEPITPGFLAELARELKENHK